jgi:hypothetical protein
MLTCIFFSLLKLVLDLSYYICFETLFPTKTQAIALRSALGAVGNRRFTHEVLETFGVPDWLEIWLRTLTEHSYSAAAGRI